MVIGTAGELPKPPTEKIVFLEDMTDSQLADAVSSMINERPCLRLTYKLLDSFACLSASRSMSDPCVGSRALYSLSTALHSLGNTCYMAATVQVLRAVPELHTTLDLFQGRGDANKDLVASMRDLYKDMGKTTDGLPPIRFLQVLRQVEPRFAEIRQGAYAQQGHCALGYLNKRCAHSTRPLTRRR